MNEDETTEQTAERDMILEVQTIALDAPHSCFLGEAKRVFLVCSCVILFCECFQLIGTCRREAGTHDTYRSCLSSCTNPQCNTTGVFEHDTTCVNQFDIPCSVQVDGSQGSFRTLDDIFETAPTPRQ